MSERTSQTKLISKSMTKEESKNQGGGVNKQINSSGRFKGDRRKIQMTDRSE